MQRLRDIQFVETIFGDTDWKNMPLKANVLYHSPHASAVDLSFLSNDTLVVLQLTTSLHPKGNKIILLAQTMKEIEQYHHDKKVIGWYISSFPISLEKISFETESLIITSGNDLEPLLGEVLLKRLTEVKRSLSSFESTLFPK